MSGHLTKADLNTDPIKQFECWFQAARKANIAQANAMTLATVNKIGQPSARTVLLKSFNERGFVFFTNYQSQKGQDIAGNNAVALLFWWEKLERQIRIQGKVEKLDAKHSDDYFQTRPKPSRIAALASQQSEVLPDKQTLIERYEQMLQQHQDSDNVLRPETWGGYVVKPDCFEFWQGCPHRLHDRLSYTKQGIDWQVQRLSP